MRWVKSFVITVFFSFTKRREDLKTWLFFSKVFKRACHVSEGYTLVNEFHLREFHEFFCLLKDVRERCVGLKVEFCVIPREIVERHFCGKNELEDKWQNHLQLWFLDS